MAIIRGSEKGFKGRSYSILAILARLTMATWSAAFAKAKSVEAEGRSAFADVLDDPTSAFASRKTKREQLAAESGIGGKDNDGRGGDEDDEEDAAKRGCFRQPRGLSQLYQRINDNPGGEYERDAEPEPIDAAKEVERKESSMAKQICRQWLKNHYLSLSQPCDGACGRAHAAPANVMHIYKDYSFKGLPKKDREKIIVQMQKEKASA